MKRRSTLAFALALASPAAAAPDDALLMADAPAPTLSAYRLFADMRAKRADPALMAYALNTPLFSDYALKARWAYMPAGARVAYRAEGVLDFPVGTVLVKNFGYPADFRRPNEAVRWLETRLLIRRAGGWVALPYVWRADGSDADLKRAGARMTVDYAGPDGGARRVDYAVPNVNQCKGCHSLDAAMSPIGPKARNMPPGLLAAWTRAGRLAGLPAGRLAILPRWDDDAQPVAARARPYLDANCGHCHNPRGPASNSGLFLTWETADPVALGIGKRPVAAGHASGGLSFDVAPGAPERSIMVHRMESVEAGVAMPELGRSVPHAEGIALVKAWIAGLRERVAAWVGAKASPSS